MGECILQAAELGKSYGKHVALQGISFSLREGEILGVAGENGAGKSTLLSLLATTQKPSCGTICFYGKEITADRKNYRTNIGYVPQEIALFEELSGYENLVFFGKAYHLKREIWEKRIAEICEETEFPEAWLHKPVKQYSGGMKRKINLGAALLHEPKLLLLDEPVANLDPEAEEQVLKTLVQLSENGTAIVYVGHQMEQMEQLCHSICLIRDGQQVVHGPMDEVLYRDGVRITLKQLWKETKKNKE